MSIGLLFRNSGIGKNIESLRTLIKSYKTPIAPELVIFRKLGFSELKSHRQWINLREF